MKKWGLCSISYTPSSKFEGIPCKECIDFISRFLVAFPFIFNSFPLLTSLDSSLIWYINPLVSLLNQFLDFLFDSLGIFSIFSLPFLSQYPLSFSLKSNYSFISKFKPTVAKPRWFCIKKIGCLWKILVHAFLTFLD